MSFRDVIRVMLEDTGPEDALAVLLGVIAIGILPLILVIF